MLRLLVRSSAITSLQYVAKAATISTVLAAAAAAAAAILQINHSTR